MPTGNVGSSSWLTSLFSGPLLALAIAGYLSAPGSPCVGGWRYLQLVGVASFGSPSLPTSRACKLGKPNTLRFGYQSGYQSQSAITSSTSLHFTWSANIDGLNLGSSLVPTPGYWLVRWDCLVFSRGDHVGSGGRIHRWNSAMSPSR